MGEDAKFQRLLDTIGQTIKEPSAEIVKANEKVLEVPVEAPQKRYMHGKPTRSKFRGRD